MKKNRSEAGQCPAIRIAAITPGNREEQAAAEISGAYAEVQQQTAELFKSGVRFGLMLREWAQFLGAQHGVNKEGAGLKAWLAEHCPEINYNTAMKYKALAEKAVTMLGGGEAARLALMGQSEGTDPAGEVYDVPAEIVEKADNLFREADSRRKFEQMWFAFSGNGHGGKREGAGRKFKGQADVAAGLEAIGKSEALAWAAAYGALETLANLQRKKDLFRRLNDDHLATASGLLADLAKASAEALEARLGGEAGLALDDTSSASTKGRAR